MTDETTHQNIIEPMQKQIEFSLVLGRTSAIYAEDKFTVYISIKNISKKKLNISDFGIMESAEFKFHDKPHLKPNFNKKLSKFISDFRKSEKEKTKEEEKKVSKEESEAKAKKVQTLIPGETYSYSFFGKATNVYWFRPDKYKFMLWVEYKEDNEDNLIKESKIEELDVLTPISSIMFGALIGGVMGGIVRIFNSKSSYGLLGTGLELLGTAILSVFAVIFVARKTGTQTLITVQDIYGGVFVGFLVGYSGRTFFDQLLGITSPPSPTNSSQTNITSTILQSLVSLYE